MITQEQTLHDESDPPRSEAAEAVAVTAAFVALASVGASFVFPVFVPFILAPVAIVLAILSKGRAQKLSQTGRRAITFALIGIGVNTAILVLTLRSAFSLMSDPAYHAQLNQMTENMYGYTFDDMLRIIDESYGTNLTEMLGAEAQEPLAGKEAEGSL